MAMRFYARYTSGLNAHITAWLTPSFKIEAESADQIIFSNSSSQAYSSGLFKDHGYLAKVYRLFDELQFQDIEPLITYLVNETDALIRFLHTLPVNVGNVSFLISKSGVHDGEFNSQLGQLYQAVNGKISNSEGDTVEVRIINFEGDRWCIGVSHDKLFGLNKEKNYLEKSSLPYHVASSMIRLSGPESTDTFLDPFTGGGILPLLRSNLTVGFKDIYAIDKSISIIKAKALQISSGRGINILSGDFFKMKTLSKDSISKVVTDPPWGRIDPDFDPKEQYPELFEKLEILLTNDATIVLLVRDKDIVDRQLERRKVRFPFYECIPIVVSGESCYLYRIESKLSVESH